MQSRTSFDRLRKYADTIQPFEIETFPDRRDFLLKNEMLQTWFSLRRERLMLTHRSWLVGSNDLIGISGSNAYGWDFVREMSLGGVVQDQGAIEVVNRFWHDKLLFGLALTGDYDFLAVSVAGEVWHGFGPEFEESALVLRTNIDCLLSLVESEVAISILEQDFVNQWLRE